MMFNDDHLFVPLDDASAGRKVWVPRTLPPSNRCLPQLRLFSVELAFFMAAIPRCNIDECIIVYAGAASGNHIPALAKLFPETAFYLYDPSNFAMESSAQLNVFREEFTDYAARQWRLSRKKIIFISDIRTIGLRGEDYEEEIGVNMETQARWVEILQPAHYLLKFRIPYTTVRKGQGFPYLGGNLMMQPFAKSLSMELRLAGSEKDARAGSKAVVYDSRKLEELLFYHNTITRPNKRLFYNVLSLDEKPYPFESRFDKSYDMSYFLYIVDLYLRSHYNLNLRLLQYDIGRNSITFAKALMSQISGERWTF